MFLMTLIVHVLGVILLIVGGVELYKMWKDSNYKREMDGHDYEEWLEDCAFCEREFVDGEILFLSSVFKTDYICEDCMILEDSKMLIECDKCEHIKVCTTGQGQNLKICDDCCNKG